MLLLFAGSLILGFFINGLQKSPLPLVYSSPKARLSSTIKYMIANAVTSGQTLDPDVKLDEMRAISSATSGIIVDARPEVFYKIGHIPSALSLPRDDFEDHYLDLEFKLSSLKEKMIVVYCSGSDCQDSQLVADSLLALGYKHVRVFRGGWEEWESAHYPAEKE